MKILSIVWYKILPPKFGGQKGIANFNKYLALHYPLVCICSKNNDPDDSIPYKILPKLPRNKLQFINPLCWRKIKSAAQKEKITHIILEHPYHGIAALKAKKTTNAKLILHSHNIEFERFRQINKWWWRLLKKYEGWIHQKADLVLFKTNSDKDFAIRRFKIDAAKCIVVPYGIEKPHSIDNQQAKKLIREKYSIGSGEKILLFAGTLDYKPNAEAVEKIYTEIVPRLIADKFPFKLIICGRNKLISFNHLKRFSHSHVINAGEVTDIENYFAAADAFINAVETGGGIQTKNIDALANHCNLVCFENSVELETIALAKDKIFIAGQGDWQLFVEKIKKATDQFTKTGFGFFHYYNWENIINGLVNKINKI